MISITLFLITIYFILLDETTMAAVQNRAGPINLGFYGILAPIINGINLIISAQMIPARADIGLFRAGVIMLFLGVVSLFGVLPPLGVVDFPGSALFVQLGTVLITVVMIITTAAGNSKYAILGATRLFYIMISYELLLTTGFLITVLRSSTLSIAAIANTDPLPISLLALVVLPVLIGFAAESNRVPFDTAEAEGELVSGFTTEIGSILFSLFILAEYAHAVSVCAISCALFALPWLGISGLILGFVIIRALFPRFRWDSVITLCLGVLLPVVFFALCGSIMLLPLGRVYTEGEFFSEPEQEPRPQETVVERLTREIEEIDAEETPDTVAKLSGQKRRRANRVAKLEALGANLIDTVTIAFRAGKTIDALCRTLMGIPLIVIVVDDAAYYSEKVVGGPFLTYQWYLPGMKLPAAFPLSVTDRHEISRRTKLASTVTGLYGNSPTSNKLPPLKHNLTARNRSSHNAPIV